MFHYKERTTAEIVPLAHEALDHLESIQGYSEVDLLEHADFDIDELIPTEDDLIEAIEFADDSGLINLVEWDRTEQLVKYEEARISRAEDDKHFGEM